MGQQQTSSLGKDAKICQIAAITKKGDTYNNYVLPAGNISHCASGRNKLTVKSLNG